MVISAVVTRKGSKTKLIITTPKSNFISHLSFGKELDSADSWSCKPYFTPFHQKSKIYVVILLKLPIKTP